MAQDERAQDDRAWPGSSMFTVISSFVIINIIDVTSKHIIFPIVARASSAGMFGDTLPVSANTEYAQSTY